MIKKTKLVVGVGINDADYTVCGAYKCPFYATWSDMLKRCYCEKYHIKYPTYIGCYVCKEWLTFSAFKAWMETQSWEGKCLDKDILYPKNKLYSSDTCVFVTRMTNGFVIESNATRGDQPIGVDFHKDSGKYRARIGNPFTRKQEHLGRFDTAADAHKAWLSRKLEFATQLAVVQFQMLL